VARGAALVVAGGLALAACAPQCPCPPLPPEPVFELRPTTFGQIVGWADDRPSDALVAFRASCTRLVDRDHHEPFGLQPATGVVGDWREPCAAAAAVPADTTADEARAFFETWFQPWKVADGGDSEGLFTGYYEPLLLGSRRNGGSYTVPLRRPPADLVRIELGRFNPDLQGYWIAGRITGSGFEPYAARGEIEAGALDGQDLELLWVDDLIDKFFLQIQGSGRVVLEDGSVVRVGYAAQNGHPYRAIGRDLIEIGAIPRDQVSLQTIRQWLRAAGPQDAAAIMDRNRSYVFFEERRELGENDGPLGSHGVPLIAGRSLAVDPRWIPLGAPVWLDTVAPYPDGEAPLRRLMIAQDTGGAIRGIVRGDVFWGAGAEAETIAGPMRSQGRYLLLLPRTLTPLG
jgi:membrane-bound lytic murein transglycosylase A